MEKDDEVKGEGNSYTTEFRQYDPRVGRWLSIDPKSTSIPWQSHYVSMDNNPIWLNDPNGDWIPVELSKAARKNGGIKKLEETFRNAYGLEIEVKRKLFGGYKMQLSKTSNTDVEGEVAQQWVELLNRDSEAEGVGETSGEKVKMKIYFVFNGVDHDGYEVDAGYVREIDGVNKIFFDLGDFNEEGILDIKRCENCNISELPENAQKSQWGMDKVMEHEIVAHGALGLPDTETDNKREIQDETSKTATGYVNRNLKDNENWMRTRYVSPNSNAGTSTLKNKQSGDTKKVTYRPKHQVKPEWR
jgi:RHS repeat-associated protein